MNDPLSKSSPLILKSTQSVISSQESEDGRSPSNSPTGKDLSGLAPVPANLFPSLERERESPTKGICGRSSDDLSKDAVLQLSLENRLRERMDGIGSLEYVLTWKRWDMGSGVSISALRASVLRQSPNACTGWPRPKATDYKNRRSLQGALTEWRRKGSMNCDLTTAAILSASLEGETGKIGVLNPELSRWLMCFPSGWSNYAGTVMR